MTGSKVSKKKSKRGRRRKKKQPLCPIKRRKKAIKRKCTNELDPSAVLNSYYVCHGVMEMLRFRKFIWKKKKKGGGGAAPVIPRHREDREKSA